MATKEYACVKRTKKAFENSLAALAQDCQLNKITVKMVCEKAQLSRNAFYFHYKDIGTLIADIEENILKEVTDIFVGLEELSFPKNVYATIDGLIDLFESRRDIVMMLLDKSFSATFTERISRMFSEFYYKYFRQVHGEKSKISYEFFYIFISGGFYSIIKYWMDNPDQMSKASLKGLTYLLIKRLLVPVDPDIENISLESK
ncbi:MAG: TetR/AcrR family transcriptional regulator [Clostridia bacterium]|nr:TetR/AcrR family transcriptional regulator [Clostridia bacterium]